MLDTQRKIADALARAMSDAFTHGLTTDDIGEIAKMVAAQQPLALDYSAQQVAELANGADDLPIYTELPEGLIDLQTASKKHSRGVSTMLTWVSQGWLREEGFYRKPGGNVAHLVVNESDLLMCKSRSHSSRYDLSVPDSDNGLPIFDELPEGLITVADASRKYGFLLGTVRNWIRKGYIPAVARLKGPAVGGGFILVRECDFLDYKDQPRKKGVPKGSHLPDDLAVYDITPLGLIDLQSAAQKYGLQLPTLRNWVTLGKVKAVGRLRRWSGHRGQRLVRESDLQVYLGKHGVGQGRPRTSQS